MRVLLVTNAKVNHIVLLYGLLNVFLRFGFLVGRRVELTRSCIVSFKAATLLKSTCQVTMRRRWRRTTTSFLIILVSHIFFSSGSRKASQMNSKRSKKMYIYLWSDSRNLVLWISLKISTSEFFFLIAFHRDWTSSCDSDTLVFGVQVWIV